MAMVYNKQIVKSDPYFLKTYQIHGIVGAANRKWSKHPEVEVVQINAGNQTVIIKTKPKVGKKLEERLVRAPQINSDTDCKYWGITYIPDMPKV